MRRPIDFLKRLVRVTSPHALGDSWLNALIENHLMLLLALVLVGGVCMLLASHLFPAGTIRRELMRDLGIAAVISFIVSLVIEYFSAKRREADIRSGILDAIMKMIIPPVVWEEIRTNIIGSQVVCESWSLMLFVSRERVKLNEAEGSPEEEGYIPTGTLTYTLRNGLGRDQVVYISHELESDIRGTEVEGARRQLPRFT